MVRSRQNTPSIIRSRLQERRRRAQRNHHDHAHTILASGIAAKPLPPILKTKHHSYLEFVENSQKKKRLILQRTTIRTPPPGFEFVAIGNPTLTNTCKELSHAQDHPVQIVSCVHSGQQNYSWQMSRIGYHFNADIVREARESISEAQAPSTPLEDRGSPEPIPSSQSKYHVQVDAALRDLFPRIPNTDRQLIVDRSFSRHRLVNGELPVGLNGDMRLAQRVQLAVLAHIRHGHTRYDDMLKVMSRLDARKKVQTLCLDTLVKWRGDEENGRDELDEILREVVIISDSEDSASESESESESEPQMSEENDSQDDPAVGEESSITRSRQHVPTRTAAQAASRGYALPDSRSSRTEAPNAVALNSCAAEKSHLPRINFHSRRGFRRYRAVGEAWNKAVRRNRSPDVIDLTDEPDRPEGHMLQRALPPMPHVSPPFDAPGRLPLSGPSAPPLTSPTWGDGAFDPDISNDALHFRAAPPTGAPTRAMPYFAPCQDDALLHQRQVPADPSIRPPPQAALAFPNAVSGQQVAERIVVNVAPLGSRQNPVLMEGRGGFYERISPARERALPVRETYPMTPGEPSRYGAPIYPDFIDPPGAVQCLIRHDMMPPTRSEPPAHALRWNFASSQRHPGLSRTTTYIPWRAARTRIRTE